jgi:hypothetical protein
MVHCINFVQKKGNDKVVIRLKPEDRRLRLRKVPTGGLGVKRLKNEEEET